MTTNFPLLLVKHTKKAKTNSSARGGEYLRPFPVQTKIFRALRDCNRRLIAAPTGLGKSHSIKMHAVYDVIQGRTAIVSVPQTVTGNNFTGVTNLYIGNKKASFKVLEEYNLLKDLISVKSDDDSGESDSRKAERLVRGLQSNTMNSTIVCTHATLVAAFALLKETGSLNLLNNTSLFIDEAHHSQCGDDDAIGANHLGKMLYDIELAGLDTNVTLTTATFYRGDSKSILPAEMLDQFSEFILPLDVYLQKHTEKLGEIATTVSLFNRNPVDCLKEYHDHNSPRREIVFLPNVNTDMSKSHGGKYALREQVMNFYSRKLTGKNGQWKLNEKYGYYECKGKILIDLVDDGSNRAVIKKYLLENQEKIKTSKYSPDFIISQDMGKEGMDFPLIDTCHVMGFRQSLTETAQILGRVLRDTKERASLNLIMENDHTDGGVDALNQFFNMFYITMLLEEVLKPVSSDSTSGNKVFVQNKEIKSAIKELQKSLITGVDFTPEYIEQLLKNSGVDKSIWDKVIKMFMRTTKNMMDLNGVDVSKIGVELFDNQRSLRNGVTTMVAKMVGVDTLKTYREAIEEQHAEKMIVLDEVRDFVIENDRLPTRGTKGACGRDLGAFISDLRMIEKSPTPIRVFYHNLIHSDATYACLQQIYTNITKLRITTLLDLCLDNYNETKTALPNYGVIVDAGQFGKMCLRRTLSAMKARNQRSVYEKWIDILNNTKKYSPIKKELISFLTDDRRELFLQKAKACLDYFIKYKAKNGTALPPRSHKVTILEEKDVSPKKVIKDAKNRNDLKEIREFLNEPRYDMIRNEVTEWLDNEPISIQEQQFSEIAKIWEFYTYGDYNCMPKAETEDPEEAKLGNIVRRRRSKKKKWAATWTEESLKEANKLSPEFCHVLVKSGSLSRVFIDGGIKKFEEYCLDDASPRSKAWLSSLPTRSYFKNARFVKKCREHNSKIAKRIGI